MTMNIISAIQKPTKGQGKTPQWSLAVSLFSPYLVV
jgi:hypothetical protein